MTEEQCFLWVEKYRARTVKDVILPKDYKNFFRKILKTKDLPNLLLSSSTPGTGKTTIAKAIAKDLGAETLYINASKDSGKDIVKTTISEFAMTMGFSGFNEDAETAKQKIVILDEADGLSVDCQKALRAFIEDYPNACRFIMTCNFPAKIIDALHEGRTMEFEFDFKKPEYVAEMKEQTVKRVEGILKYEKIKYDKQAIVDLVEAQYPSIRKVIAICQKYAMMKDEIDKDIVYYKNIGEELSNLVLNKKHTEARKYINEHGLSYSDVFSYFFVELIPKLKNKGLGYKYLSDYEYRCSFSADPSIQIAACMIDLFSCI